MLFTRSLFNRTVGLFLALLLSVSLVPAQGTTSGLRGQVVDEFGAVIVGAKVTVTDEKGATKTATTNNEGGYIFNSLAPGRYTVLVVAKDFVTYTNEVLLEAGKRETLDLKLSVSIGQQDVEVASENSDVNTEPENNASAIVLKEKDIEALPEDPDELAAALQAMAGPSAGPNGGQIFIDGFTGGRMPPRESIREVRINQNPMSAEYDRVGFGRIEILTKPGTDRLRGQAYFSFNDEALNSRNPFATNRAPHQVRNYGGHLTGTLIPKKSSFFVDLERRETDDNEVINATILDQNLNIAPFSLAVVTPRRRLSISPRLDYQLNAANTLVGRYSYSQGTSNNLGIGNFSLPSRAFDREGTEQTIQLTETAIINQRIVNETRFQYIREREQQRGDNTIPTISVLDAFTGGGSQVGQAFENEDRFELQNYTSWTMKAHALKAGVRWRRVQLTDVSPNNFGGTFTFTGGAAPQLNANNEIIRDAQGNPLTQVITSIERYRRTLLLQQAGFSGAQIRTLGGGPTQFSIAGGNPEAAVSQSDVGLFIQDDWRWRPNLTVSAGLRYENQTNINSNYNFAPRLAIAWAPGQGQSQRAKVVLRGGFGLFYDRFGENYTLQANRFNGVNQLQFIVPNPDFFPTVPGNLNFARSSQAIRQVAENLETPVTRQIVFSAERQLTNALMLSATYFNARTSHVIRSRNINAPLPGTFTPGVPNSGVRPLGDIGNVYQFESNGRSNQNRLFVRLNYNHPRYFSVMGGYSYGNVKSDTDFGTFPANSYDLAGEYGRASFDVRHNLFLFNNINLPWGLRANTIINLSSGRPFNITTGRDTNGDSLFTERPAFATDLNKFGVVVTPYGAFDPNPGPGQTIIPRNFGEGPGFFNVNFNLRKTFSFGERAGAATASGAGRGGDGGGGRMMGGPGMGGGPRGGGGGGGHRGGGDGGGFFGGGEGSGRYNLTASLEVSNLFNHTNPGAPVGNLSSALFGRSTQTAGGFGFGPGGGGGGAAGNRRVSASLRFSF